MQNARLIPFYLLSSLYFITFLAHGLSPINLSPFFEPNLKQIDSDVLFFSRSTPISLACYRESIVFFDMSTNACIKVNFGDAQPQSVAGSIPLLSYSSYFMGNINESSPIHTPHYKAVIYKELYPKIDLYLYEKNKSFEFDFIVYSLANWDKISINFEILKQNVWTSVIPEISGNKIIIKNTNFEFCAPNAFQWINGRKIITPLQIYFNNGIKFKFSDSNINPSYPIIIDPTLLAGTYLGGNDTDKIIDVKVDSAGNIYLLGETKTPNFPTSSGSFQINFAGGDITGDIFLTKMNPTANQIIFSTFLGGSGDDSPTSLAIDTNRNIYIAGITSSSDFPVTPNALQNFKLGNRDGIVAKLSSNGQSLLYSSYLGGSADESIMSLDIMPSSQLVLTGWTQSNDFPIVGSSNLNSTFRGGIDGFLVKYDTSMNVLWSGYIGSTGMDLCKVVRYYNNSFVIGGYTSSTNFSTTQGVIQSTYGGGSYDSFVTVLSSENGAALASTFIGGNLIDLCQSLCIDSTGNIYITGETSSANFPVTISSFQIGYGGGERDVFLTKLNSSLNQLLFSSYLGGSKTEVGLGVALDSASRAYIVGYTYSGDFPVIYGTLQPNYGGNQDAFFSCFSKNGNLLQYSTFYGGNKEEKARGLFISSSDVMYMVGETASTILPITSGTYQTGFGGGYTDGFLASIDISSPSNEGEGQVEGSSEGGSYEGSYEGEGLRIWLVAPVERTLKEGSTTTFIIGISGYTGTVNYQWQFKSFTAEEYTPILNSNSPMLTLRNIKLSSAGFYRCRVTDSQGTAFSSPFRLNVLVQTEGSTEGSNEGNSEGIYEGEGNVEGNIEGQIEGVPEGSVEGVIEGIISEGEGNTLEGISEGEVEGSTNSPCNLEISGTETHSLLMDMAQNIYYIFVPTEGILNDIIINISLTHDDLRQILIQIISPVGTELFLMIYPPQGGKILNNVFFDDNAELSILDGTSPFTGSYKPIGYLGTLKGENIYGKWTLRIVDSQSGGRGYLEGWKLLFNTYSCMQEGQSNEGEIAMYHSADINHDFSFSLAEILRVIQIFNYGAYHCDSSGEDRFGLGFGDQNCKRHDTDYLPPYWTITLPELLRLIQFFNIGGYGVCAGTEDGFCLPDT